MSAKTGHQNLGNYPAHTFNINELCPEKIDMTGALEVVGVVSGIFERHSNSIHRMSDLSLFAMIYFHSVNNSLMEVHS